MPAVLRSKIKSEAEPLGDDIRDSPPKTIGRRQRKRKRSGANADDENASDSIISDEESRSYSRSLCRNRPFEIIAGLPCSLENAQYNSALTHPLSVKDSAVLYDSIVRSRKTWVLGEMFEIYFIKSAKPAPEAKPMKQDGSPHGMIMQVRDKMQKMCDCTMLGGPHTFPIRLFILKNDDMEKKWQEEQDLKRKEKEDKRKHEQEEKKRKMEERKQQQMLRKQEREKMIRLQKENKAKAKMEQEYLKLKRKEEMKKAKEEYKKLKKTNPTSNRSPHARISRTPPASQSVTDPKMIANLNLMAQRDSNLNSLMAVVAKGDATLEQVEEFKKFIEIAKKMPPPPGWSPSLPLAETSTETKESATHEKLTKARSTKSPQKIASEGKADDKVIDTKIDVKEKNDSSLKINAAKESPMIKKETESLTKASKKQSTESTEEERSMQLTAFQQKYIEGAQLILEYQENTHARYMLPKEAIIEYLESSGDFIISWILIHNKKEILRHKSKRIRELCKGLKTEEETRKVAEEYDVYSERGCPIPLYSPMTIKISGIHIKFAPIVLNSVEPTSKVQRTMAAIIDIGTRLSGYNLWYQLDAYDDKDLAESVRVGLNEHEQELKSRKPKK